jgi:hypothetical protein
MYSINRKRITQLVACSRYWVFSCVNVSPADVLAKRGGFIDSYKCLGFSLRRHFRGADVLLAGQTVVSSTRVMVWVFPHVKISRGADVLLGGQTVLAINVFGPNRGTQNTLAAVVGNVNTRSIVLTIHFAGHTVK